MGSEIMLNKAIILSTTFHENQVDKAGQPYILHPLRVMLNPMLTTEKERIVAVLHDIIEDTSCNLLMLREQGFDDDIIEAIRAITHLPNEPQIEYLNRVKRVPLALSVKKADICDNLNPDRMNELPAIDQFRLKNKYKVALEYLNN